MYYIIYGIVNGTWRNKYNNNTNTNTNSINNNNIMNIKNDKDFLQGNNQNAIMISTSILLSMKRRNIIIHTRVMITITVIQKTATTIITKQQ